MFDSLLLVLWLQMQSNQVATVTYSINLWSENEAIMIFNNTSPLSGQLVWLNGAPAASIFLAEIVCIQAGTARGMWQMELNGGSTAPAAPITLFFKYTCSPPLFNVGLQPFGTDVIAQGVYNQNWLPSGSVGPAETISLFVILDQANAAPSNPFNFRLISNDPTATDPTVEDYGLNSTATKDGVRSSQNPLVLSFNCAPCVEALASPIVYEMAWGWANPVLITIHKDCVPDVNVCGQPGGSGSPSSGGLGGGAIAAIVIFVILAAFCFSGCLFNKFHGGKSGWMVIPCSEQAAACLDSANTGGRARKWSPQEEGTHYDPTETLNSGGGGYQSYSNNL